MSLKALPGARLSVCRALSFSGCLSAVPARFPPLFHARKRGEVTESCACILPRVPYAVSPWKGLVAPSGALDSAQSEEIEGWKDGKKKWAGFSRIFGFVRLGVSRRKEGSGIWGVPALWNPVWSCVLGWAKLSCLHTLLPKVGQDSFKYVLIKKNEIYSLNGTQQT